MVAAYQGLVTLQAGALSALRSGLAAAVAAIQSGVSQVTIPVPSAVAITLSDLSAPPQAPAFVLLQVQDGGQSSTPIGQFEDRRLFTIRAVVGLTAQRTSAVGGATAAGLDGTALALSALCQAVESALLSGLGAVAGVYAAQIAAGYPQPAPRALRSSALATAEVRVEAWMQSYNAHFG
jgi:hypothetical protein